MTSFSLQKVQSSSSNLIYYPISASDISPDLLPKCSSSLSHIFFSLFEHKCEVITQEGRRHFLSRSKVSQLLKKRNESASESHLGTAFSKMLYVESLQKKVNKRRIVKNDLVQISQFPLGISVWKRSGLPHDCDIFDKYVLYYEKRASKRAQTLVKSFYKKYMDNITPYTFRASFVPSSMSKGIVTSHSHVQRIEKSLRFHGVSINLLKLLLPYSEWLPFPNKYFIPDSFFSLITSWIGIRDLIPPQVTPLHTKRDPPSPKSLLHCLNEYAASHKMPWLVEQSDDSLPPADEKDSSEDTISPP